MKKFYFPNINEYSSEPKVMCLGKFESIHLGHKKILIKGKKISLEKKYEFGVMIFGEREKNNLYSLNERIESLKKYGVDWVMIFERKKENFNIEHENFENILSKMNVKDVVLGPDFVYGKDRKGNIDTISKIFTTHIISEQKINENKISSTMIFNSIKSNKLDLFKNMMNEYFSYSGIVVKGLGNGKKFGMPTANIDYNTNKIDIESGIYYSFAIYNEKQYDSLTSISNNPTLFGNKKTYETFIYSFDKDIYGEKLEVRLIKKYRDSIKFDTIQKLIQKLSEDKISGKEFFNLYKQGKI